jgi:hypothetical protein
MEKKREELDVSITLLSHSRFNTRKTRNPEDIKLLAERIKKFPPGTPLISIRG